jgi:nucleoid-associated protein YgaU
MNAATMNAPIAALLRLGVIPPVSFPADSRYQGSATLTYTTRDGRNISYLARRFVPQPADFATVAQHTVKQGDRLDLLAARYLGDPLLFWLICDANSATRPDALVERPGTVLNLTMPQGIPGAPRA